MSIAAVSSQSGQSSQSDTTTLEASKKKIVTEIKKLQKEDAIKNAKEIQTLQQQVQQIEMQIAQQSATSQTTTASANTSSQGKVGPAYSVELGNKNAPSSTNSLREESSTASEAAQSIDLSI